ncbi:ABC transporter transmembrane domain-containing protein [Anaerococcus cruorum]|uniref:ABC transporter transmembrane domain-containing protein n=1 Tax=Anaerococcus sp. WGS1596 TaxID=3366806 RepID=UPI00372D3AC6
MSKSTQDVSQVAQFAGFGVLAFFDAVLFPVFIIVMMIATIDFKMTILAIIPYVVLAFGYYNLMDKIYNRSKLVNKSFDELTDNVLEDVEGIRIIRVYNVGKLRAEKFKQKTRELADRYVNLVKVQALIEPFEIFVTSISYAIAVGFGAYLVSSGNLSVGKIVSFTYYLGMLVWPMFALGEFLNLSQQASAAMDRIVELLNYKEEINDTSSLKNASDNPDIEFINHSYKYPSSKKDILEDINLSIENGTSLGIVGKTGSGKTTLIRQLLDIYKVDKDSIIIGNDSFDEVSAKSFKENIGYVPQKAYDIF